jgi:hypothetical protein
VGVMLVSRSDCLAGAKQRNELFWTEKYVLKKSAQKLILMRSLNTEKRPPCYIDGTIGFAGCQFE